MPFFKSALAIFKPPGGAKGMAETESINGTKLLGMPSKGSKAVLAFEVVIN